MVSVILINPETPGNTGFIARAMANFGLSELILVEPGFDARCEEAYRFSMHARHIIDNAVVKDRSYDIKGDFDIVIGTTSVMGSDYNIQRSVVDIRDLVLGARRAALVFGNEGTGLSKSQISKCDFLVAVPTSKKYAAMNISHAAAIIFYELFKGSKDRINSHLKPAGRRELEVMGSLIDEILEELDFSTGNKRETQRMLWRKLLTQSMMTNREANTALGFLRKIRSRVSKS